MYGLRKGGKITLVVEESISAHVFRKGLEIEVELLLYKCSSLPNE
jgi:hypothetical protein